MKTEVLEIAGPVLFFTKLRNYASAQNELPRAPEI
jgi:hypothetical protein